MRGILPIHAVSSANAKRGKGRSARAARPTTPRAFSFDALEERALLSFGPVGAELIVTTAGSFDAPAVAARSTGSFVVVWRGSDVSDTSGVFAQRYDAAGAALGWAFPVNNTTTNDQSDPVIGMDAAGGFVVAWASYQQAGDNGRDVYARRFSSAGNALGSEFRVNETTTSWQDTPAIAVDPAGNFVIVWDGSGSGGSGIYARRFDSTGAALSSEFRVDQGAMSSADEAVIGMDDSGNFVIAWSKLGAGEVYARGYDSSGTALGSEFRVNTYTTGDQGSAAIAVDSDGDFFIAWESGGQDGAGYGIFAQRYDSAGVALGPEFRVNAFTTSDQRYPAVARDGFGGFVVGWNSTNQAGASSAEDQYFRRYDAAGVAATAAEFRLNSFTTSGQENIALAVAAPGTFAAVWESFGQAGGSYNYVTRRLGEVVNSAPSADAGGPYSVPQGGPVTLNASASFDPDAGQTATLSYWWDVNGDGTFGDAIGISPTLTWSQLVALGITSIGDTRAVRVAAQDVSGGSTVSGPVNLTVVVNQPPIANAGGPYSIVEGQSLTLSGSAVDPDGLPLATYSWDINGDLVFGDAVGQSVTVTPSQLLALGLGDDGPSSSTVRLMVTDSAGATGTSPGVALSIANAPPSDAAIAPTVSDIQTGVAASFILVARDPSATDQAAGFSFAIDWNGDNTFDETVIGPSGTSVSHTFLAPGLFQVAVLATDKDSGTSTLFVLPVLVTNGPKTVGPLVPEFRINTSTINHQRYAAVATDSAGNFVVTWTSRNQDTIYWGEGICAQRFNAAGVPLGPEFRVNDYVSGDEQFPAIGMDRAGNFVIAWTGDAQEGSSNFGIYAKRYDASGVALGPAFHVNTFTSNNQQGAAVAMDADGDFVIVWQSSGQDGSSGSVHGQRYSKAGQALGAEFRVNTYTTNNQFAPKVAMNALGDFVVAWVSSTQDGSVDGVYAQRYSAAGQAVGLEFRVNTHIIGNQNTPSIAMDTLGDFVVVWASSTQDGGTSGVYGRRYDSSGVALGSEFRVNTYTTNSQLAPVVAMDAAGGFAVAWQSLTQDLDQEGIYVQRYDQAGTALNLEFRANTWTTGGQTAPAIAMNEVGRFVVSWDSQNQDGDLSGVYGLILGSTIANSTPNANAGGPYYFVPGNSLQLNASATTDPDPGQALVYAWDVNGDGVYTDAAGVVATLSTSALAALGITSVGDVRSVRVRVTDIFGAVQTSAPTTLTVVANTPPVANAGGPYNVAEGAALTLDASLSYDPDPGVPQGLTVAWDLNGDGVYTDASGIKPIVSWAQLLAFGFSEGPGSSGAVRARVTDSLGLTTTSPSVSLTVVNRAPGAAIAGPSTALVGVSQNFTLSAFDPSTGDQAAGFTFQIDWNGDGIVDQTEVGPSGTVVAYSFAAAGIVNVKMTATDRDGGISLPSAFQVLVTNAGATFGPWGGESLTSSHTPTYRPSVAVDPTGGYVIVWDALWGAGDEEDLGVFGRRFNRDGVALGPDFLINQRTQYGQSSASVAMDVAGNFVVVWTDQTYRGYATENKYRIMARLYDASGAALGDEFAVSQFISTAAFEPRVARAPSGDFVVAWRSSTATASTARWFDAAGNPRGAEVSLGTNALDATPALDAAGNCVIAYTDYNNGDVYAVRFDPFGTQQGSPFLVQSIVNGTARNATVTMRPDGQFAVAYYVSAQFMTPRLDVRLYDAAGNSLGSPVTITTVNSTTQTPALAVDANGNYLIAWKQYSGSQWSNAQVVVRQYSSSLVAGPTYTTTTSLVSTTNVALAVNAAGRGVAAWARQDPLYAGMHQRFGYNALPEASAGGPYGVTEGGGVGLVRHRLGPRHLRIAELCVGC